MHSQSQSPKDTRELVLGCSKNPGLEEFPYTKEISLEQLNKIAETNKKIFVDCNEMVKIVFCPSEHVFETKIHFFTDQKTNCPIELLEITPKFINKQGNIVPSTVFKKKNEQSKPSYILQPKLINDPTLITFAEKERNVIKKDDLQTKDYFRNKLKPLEIISP